MKEKKNYSHLTVVIIPRNNPLVDIAWSKIKRLEKLLENSLGLGMIEE